MERFFKKYLPATLALALSTQASAAVPTLIWCNACSDQQKQAAAVESDAGALVYVADVVDRSLAAYTVDLTQKTPNAWRSAGALSPIVPTAEQAQAIRTLADFYEAAPQGWHKSNLLDYTEDAINAYSVARDGPEQRMLVDWVARQREVVPVELLGRLARSLAALDIHEKSDTPSVAYRVDFRDGSQINISFDFASQNAAFVVAAEPGQDSRHNPILTEASKLPVLFDLGGKGNPNDDRDWHTHMAALGYAIPDRTAGAQWACFDSGTGLRCTHPG